jgi:hypothetical protein
MAYELIKKLAAYRIAAILIRAGLRKTEADIGVNITNCWLICCLKYLTQI